jgi:purine-cytosine permease-like protein
MGMLGPVFGLSVNLSIGLTALATALGSIIPAFTATMCPMLGLRQIAASRYAFGIWGSKFCGLLNIIVNIGFGSINCIVAGQLLAAVSDGSISEVVGIVIVLVCAYIISFFGFRIIHRYESVAWVLIFILLCCDYGLSAKYFSPTPGLSYLTGLDKTGSALSYFAVIFGASAAWCSMSGDYYVHYPTNTNKWMIFGLTWFGLTLPTMFVTMLGNILGGVVNTNEEMANIYQTGGFGALIIKTMRPTGFAKFVGVMYTLSFSKSRDGDNHPCSLGAPHNGLTYFISISSWQSSCYHLLLFPVHSTLGSPFISCTSIHLEHSSRSRRPGYSVGRQRSARSAYQ